MRLNFQSLVGLYLVTGLLVGAVCNTGVYAQVASSTVIDEPTSPDDAVFDRLNMARPQATAKRRFFHAVVYERNNLGGYGVYSRAKGSLVTGLRRVVGRPPNHVQEGIETSCLFTIVGENAAHWTRRCSAYFAAPDSALYSANVDESKGSFALSATDASTFFSIMLGRPLESNTPWAIAKSRTVLDGVAVQALGYPYGYMVGTAIGVNPWTAIPIGVVAAGVVALELAELSCVDETFDTLKVLDEKHFIRLLFVRHTPKCEAGFKK